MHVCMRAYVSSISLPPSPFYLDRKDLSMVSSIVFDYIMTR
jgi:hypothetical protein